MHFVSAGPSELDNFSDDLRGVIPRSFEYLFFLINREVERVRQVSINDLSEQHADKGTTV